MRGAFQRPATAERHSTEGVDSMTGQQPYWVGSSALLFVAVLVLVGTVAFGEESQAQSLRDELVASGWIFPDWSVRCRSGELKKGYRVAASKNTDNGLEFIDPCGRVFTGLLNGDVIILDSTERNTDRYGQVILLNPSVDRRKRYAILWIASATWWSQSFFHDIHGIDGNKPYDGEFFGDYGRPTAMGEHEDKTLSFSNPCHKVAVGRRNPYSSDSRTPWQIEVTRGWAGNPRGVFREEGSYLLWSNGTWWGRGKPDERWPNLPNRYVGLRQIEQDSGCD
jgi:hypothetical protein